MTKNRRTEVLMTHVTPELKAKIEAEAERRGLKISPYLFSILKRAHDREEAK